MNWIEKLLPKRIDDFKLDDLEIHIVRPNHTYGYDEGGITILVDDTELWLEREDVLKLLNFLKENL